MKAVTYSNAAKMRQLRVPPRLLEEKGAVSAEAASAMAQGVRATSGSDLGLAVTGIAGPDGGNGENRQARSLSRWRPRTASEPNVSSFRDHGTRCA